MSWGSDDEAAGYDEDRQALVDLLVARGHHGAAAVVAASEYSTAWNDDLGDGFCVWLAVPAALYDRARSEFRDDIDRACVDVVGERTYSGLRFAVRRTALRPHLIEEILTVIAERRWVDSERVNPISLAPAGGRFDDTDVAT